ncbi:hypothetical protein ACIGAN_35470 [Streptomyces sp. NPDC085931]|uniref:hypothetical protein n=1 Tax=Streptomyces sp. NPDC085931 TaxID=3365740 RepID=UPI0037D53B57
MAHPPRLRPEDRADFEAVPRPSFGPGGPLPALAVLTPLVAAGSAGALLLLGGVLRAAGARGPLPGSLGTAGWTLALVAAVTGLAAGAAPLRAALRRRAGPPTRSEAAITPCSPPDTLAPCPARARKDRTPCSD